MFVLDEEADDMVAVGGDCANLLLAKTLGFPRGFIDPIYVRFLYNTEFWPMRLLPFVHVIEEYAPGIETLDCMDKGN